MPKSSAVLTYMQSRKAAAKATIITAIETLEDGVRKARRAIEADDEVFTSFLHCVPSLIEAAAKHATYSEAARIIEDEAK